MTDRASQQNIKNEIINIIKAVVGTNVCIFLFGSRARGDNKLFSDYDIGLIAENPISQNQINLIIDKLKESNLPFAVDVINFNEVSEIFKSIAMENIEIWSNPHMIKFLNKNKPN